MTLHRGHGSTEPRLAYLSRSTHAQCLCLSQLSLLFFTWGSFEEICTNPSVLDVSQVCVYLYVYVYGVGACMFCMCLHVCVWCGFAYVCLNVCIGVCSHVCVVWMFVCVHVCVCADTHMCACMERTEVNLLFPLAQSTLFIYLCVCWGGRLVRVSVCFVCVCVHMYACMMCVCMCAYPNVYVDVCVY